MYRWGQKGSYSIKAVPPLLAPDLSFDDLEVADSGLDNLWCASWRRCGG